MENKEKNDLFKKRLYKLTLDIIALIEKLPKDQTSNIISGQLIRSATSICANYIEAYAASSKKDFANFFRYALKSANESKFWVSLLKDTKKISNPDAEKALIELKEVSNILAASILTMKKNK